MKKTVYGALITSIVLISGTDVNAAQAEQSAESQLSSAIDNHKLGDVRQLIREDPSLITTRLSGLADGPDLTPLIYAVVCDHFDNNDIVQYLVDSGAPLDATASSGIPVPVDQYQLTEPHTALYYAAAYNRLRAVKYLIKKGAYHDKDERKAISAAAQKQADEAAGYTQDIAQKIASLIDAWNKSAATLQASAKAGKLSNVKKCINDFPWLKNQDRSDAKKAVDAALTTAIDKGHAKVVEYLITTKNAKVDTKTNSALTAAIEALNQFLNQAGEKKLAEVVKAIKKEQARLQKMIDKNIDKEQHTAIFYN